MGLFHIDENSEEIYKKYDLKGLPSFLWFEETQIRSIYTKERKSQKIYEWVIKKT